MSKLIMLTPPVKYKNGCGDWKKSPQPCIPVPNLRSRRATPPSLLTPARGISPSPKEYLPTWFPMQWPAFAASFGSCSYSCGYSSGLWPDSFYPCSRLSMAGAMMPVFTFRRFAPCLILLQSCFSKIQGLSTKKHTFLQAFSLWWIDTKQQNFHQFSIANWKNLCYEI